MKQKKTKFNGGWEVGRQFYEHNQTDLINWESGAASSYRYEDMDEADQVKVRDILIKRKRGFETLNLSSLTKRLQELFGSIYKIPDKWWLEYEWLEGLDKSDEEFIHLMVTNPHPADYGWEEAVRLSPKAAKLRAQYICALMQEHVEDISYIKLMLHCAKQYAKVDNADEMLEGWAKHVLSTIRNYLYDMNNCPDFFDTNYEDEGSYCSYVLNRYSEWWDAGKAELELGFNVRERFI